MINRHIVPRDAVLPQINVMLDAQAMARQFDRHVMTHSKGRFEVRSCLIDRIKYRPGRNCTVGYRLLVEDIHRHLRHEQRLYGRLFSMDEAQRRFSEQRMPDSDAVNPLPTVSLMHTMPMLVWRFPYDRKLRALPRLADASSTGLFAASMMTRAHDVAPHQHDVVSYFPEHTCTVRVEQKSLGASMRDRWQVYGKIRYDDAGAETYRIMNELVATKTLREGLGFAQPLRYQAQERVLWQAGLHAPTLAKLIDTGKCTDAVLCGVARGLARLHALHVPLTRASALPALLSQLREAASIVGAAAPEHTAAVEAAVQTLCARADELDPSLTATLHGDIHSNNILVARDKIYLIDLDRVAKGMPLTELGALLAEFATRDCVNEVPVNFDTIDELINGYASVAGRRFSVREIAWHFAACLIGERAKRCVTSLKPGRMAALPRVIATARAVLADPWVLNNGVTTRRALA